MDFDFIIKASGFLLALIAQVVFVSRAVSRQGFKTDSTMNMVKKLEKSTFDSNEKIEKKIEKLSSDLFPNGKPVFIYKEDCKGCHKDVCDVIRREIGTLKDEFIKRDDSRQDAHSKLHSRIDEIIKDIIKLKAKVMDE